MPVLSLPTLDLYYERHGKADAPSLVLLHGATETFQVSWKRLIAPFAARFDVIGIDLRGHGQSTNPADGLDLRQMADDVAGLLDALNVRAAHVCGFSGGASTALFFGARHAERVRSLILISNNFERDEARLASGFWAPEAIAERDALWLKGMAVWHREAPETLLGWWEAEDRVRPNFTTDELAALHMPVLVIGGDRDPVVPLDQTVRLYQALPNAQLAILPGIGHGAPHRAARGVETLVTHFIEGVETPNTRGGNR